MCFRSYYHFTIVFGFGVGVCGHFCSRSFFSFDYLFNNFFVFISFAYINKMETNLDLNTVHFIEFNKRSQYWSNKFLSHLQLHLPTPTPSIVLAIFFHSYTLYFCLLFSYLCVWVWIQLFLLFLFLCLPLPRAQTGRFYMSLNGTYAPATENGLMYSVVFIKCDKLSDI